MADTKLILGGIAFRDFEIPEKISYGVSQSLEIHKLVGKGRVVDAMGPEYQPIRWQGRFRGRDAVGRAKRCERLAASGAGVSLVWGGYHWRVVVESFEADYERFYEIPYSINCEVTDNGGALGGLLSSLSSLISVDVSAIAGLVGRL